MAETGDADKLIVFVIEESPIAPPSLPPLAPTTVQDCCFELNVFSTVVGTDPEQNDRTGFIAKYGLSVTAVSLVIQKFNGSDWVDITTITDNTYGIFFALGTYGDSDRITGLYIDWRQVLIDFDPGSYRMKTIEANILASVPDQNSFSEQYCLREFSADKANGTVRFHTVISGIQGDLKDRSKLFNFPTNWRDMIRIPARFGDNNSEYEQTFTQFRDGSKVSTKDIQTEKYILTTQRMPAAIHDFLKTRIFQADDLFVTDYNTNNANVHLNTKIVKPSEYSPNWTSRSKLASVTVEFEDGYNNKVHKNC